MNINLIDKLKENKVLPIIRSSNPQEVIDTVYALLDGGIDVMEVNVQHPSIFEAINEVSKDAIICAGGIITTIQAQAAMDVGAKIISSPIFQQNLLKISKDKIISVAEIGETKPLRVGDTVFAIGAPLDDEYSWTVTIGILSGKDRLVDISASSSTTADWVMSVLQTDAAINSGNSGGPLANSNGEVIGITNMKLVSDGVEGIGFAIPVEDAITYLRNNKSGQ